MRVRLGRRLALLAVRIYAVAEAVAGEDELLAYQAELERERLAEAAA